MGSPVEADLDFSFSDRHISWHVDQITEDLTSLGVGVASHPAREDAIEAARDHQESHVEIDFQSDGRGEGVHMEKANGVGEGVFDEHALGVASHEFDGGDPVLIGQENGGFVMAEVLDIDLTKAPPSQTNRLLVDARGAVLAGRHVQFDCAPRRAREEDDFLEERGTSPAQGDEGDLHLVEACEVGVGGQP